MEVRLWWPEQGIGMRLDRFRPDGMGFT